MRLRAEPLTDVEVTDLADALTPPVAWTLRGRRYWTVERHAFWISHPDWWLLDDVDPTTNTEVRHYTLLAESAAGGRGVLDISCDMATTPPSWRLDRVHD